MVAVAPAALVALVTMVRPSLMAATGWRAAALVVATLVEFVIGWPFLREAARRTRRRSANMDTLVAVGTLAAYGFSVWELATGGMRVYFETAILLIAFLSLGRYLEARARAAPARRSARCWSWAPKRPAWSATTARSWSPSSRSRSRT